MIIDFNVLDASCDCEKCLMLLCDDRVIRKHASEELLLEVIMSYDEMCKEKAFNFAWFECAVSKCGVV